MNAGPQAGADAAPGAAAETARGLSSAEAAARLGQYGPNAVVEQQVHPVRQVLRHFSGPVPWMLEATVVLQLLVGERVEALMIVLLLLLNVALGVVQESRAGTTLEMLKQRLAPRARVRRDAEWHDVAAAELVPGDVVKLSLGGVVPADVRILSGSLLADQSMLTGESVAADLGPGAMAYAGALVRRGEAEALVTATGGHTYFGRTAELVRVAHVESSEQQVVLRMVGALSVVNFLIVLGMVAYAVHRDLAAREVLRLVLTAMLSAVPVALPATFTLAAAVGARRLAAQGVLLTRLSSLQEAAAIDVLCVDKTGTLTENALAVGSVVPLGEGRTAAAVLAYAAAASSADGSDPVDTAVRNAAAAQPAAAPAVTRFMPFDPEHRLAQAQIRDAGDGVTRIIKGAPDVVFGEAAADERAQRELERLSAAGYRVLAVASGPPDRLRLAGLIGLADPPRRDSAQLLRELRALGVSPIMATGDEPATAATVARAIGLTGAVHPAGAIADDVSPGDFGIYAGVLPEDKFRLVRAFEGRGHGVGMCGDGANDAPALRQAQLGIAVSSATDVAKSAAGVVLTRPGLTGIVSCIREGRSAFQRVMTFTLTIFINKSATLIIMGAGLLLTGHAILTPFLQALSMLAGDMVTMARAVDHVPGSPYPNHWRVRNLVLAAVPIGLFKLAFCLGAIAAGWLHFRLGTLQMQTLAFLTLIYAGQVNTYVMRERGSFWHSRPPRIMVLASLADLALVTTLAAGGILMAGLPAALVAGLAAATVLFLPLHDLVKRATLRLLPID